MKGKKKRSVSRAKPSFTIAKNKLTKYREIKTFDNVFELESGKLYMGKWKDEFGLKKKLILELGCGKGEFCCHLAQQSHDNLLIGIDYKGDRIWKGAKYSIQNNISNILFLRIQIEALDDYFTKEEIDEVWIPFPDPFLKKSKAKKRLVSERFLSLYDRITNPNCDFHLKTDVKQLYDYTIDNLKKINKKIVYYTENLNQEVVDSYNSNAKSVHTFYEKKFMLQQKPIFYIRWKH